MTKTTFADFMNSSKAEPKKGVEVELDVTCQQCHAWVGVQEYFPVERLLKWSCADGHISFIEEFRL